MQATNRATSRLGLLSAALLGLGLFGLGLLGIAASQGHAATMSEWERYDGNRDGAVSLAEFKAQQGEERAFREADANQDGRLDDAEFVKARSIDVRIKAGAYFDDGWITTKVKASLVKDDLMNGLDIKVTTQNGVVQLSGFVESSDQVARAVKIAGGVEGVKQLENNLLIKR